MNDEDDLIDAVNNVQAAVRQLNEAMVLAYSHKLRIALEVDAYEEDEDPPVIRIVKLEGSFL